MESKDSVEIVEITPITVRKINFLIGLPDVGLVGMIAASHLVESLNMNVVGYLESDLFPPVIVLHGNKIYHPFRIYQKDNILLLLSEIPVPPLAVNAISQELTKWLKEKNASLIMPLGGVPVPNRMAVEEPDVYTVPTNDIANKLIDDFSLLRLDEGIMAGPYASILLDCKKLDLPCLALLAQSFPNYPDPGAAASVIKVINKVLKMNIDVGELIKNAEEIRVKTRDLMQRTNEQGQTMGKSQEYDLPAMYS
ncbi:MAG: proteasome assembly chaperone family protein [Candidatus Freyarchaeum deiterrae]